MKKSLGHTLLGLLLFQFATNTMAQDLPGKGALAESAFTEAGNGPFVQTLWGQVNCKDEDNMLINVTNLNTPNHYAAGCVAISLASVMHHYQWPLSGTGENSYKDSYGSSTGSYSADFANTIYDMELMLQQYNHLVSSSAERSEAGKLAFHSAVALEMDFEHDGSTSSVNRIPRAAANYFRYYGFYKDPDSPVFWELLDENMEQQVPVILAIRASNGAQHSVLCDGMNYANGKVYYHLNMGWWGASNGWFPLRGNWLAGGYNEITGAVFDLIPCPALMEAEGLAEGQLNLSWFYPANPVAEAYELQQREADGNWETLAADYIESSFLAKIDPELRHTFRVRAKVHGEYYPSAWSNTIEYFPVGLGYESMTDGLRAYPVPVGEVLFLEGLDNYSGSLQIFSSDGSLRYAHSLENTDAMLEIQSAHWSSGIYYLIISGTGQKVVKKIIKTNN